ncbi:MAG: type II toxin-antitoxin system RelE/ParE family toxin [Pseudomonadota bacterium]
MVQVNWSQQAITNLELIRNYIHQFDPYAAERFATRLIDAAQSLQDYPERGRPGTFGKRELVIVRPYIIRYQYDGDSVLIISIRHAAQNRE